VLGLGDPAPWDEATRMLLVLRALDQVTRERDDQAQRQPGELRQDQARAAFVALQERLQAQQSAASAGAP